MRKLLVAVDGSQHSDHAVLFAVNFVKEHGPVEIHLINVEPKPVAWQTRGMEPESIRAHLATLSHETMRPAHDILKAADISCRMHARIGGVAGEVGTQAAKLGWDTIILGTRGLGAIAGFSLGSISRKVLHLSHLPVICVK